MSVLDVFTLAERGGIYTTALITVIVVQAIKQTKLNNRYMPLWSLLIGAISGIFVGIVFHSDILIGVVDGLVAGAVAAGSFDVIKIIGQEFGFTKGVKKS